MAWTAPKTWTTGELVTAALANQQWRDNFLETAPAKATAAGDVFVATAANAIKRLALGAAKKLLGVNSGATDVEWGPAYDTAAAANTIIQRDAAGRAQVVAPSASGDVALKSTVDDHINDATAAHAGSAISNTPAGSIAATTVQAAIDELDTEKIAIPGSSAQGDVLYRDATGWTRLAAGTSGQLLKTQGAGANPLWATLAAAQIATGSYTGDGTDARTITVGFTPKLVIVSWAGGPGMHFGHHSNGIYGAEIYGSAAVASNNDGLRPDVTTNGFLVNYNAGSGHLNSSGYTYYWTAIG